VTPQKLLLETQVISLQVPGSEGYLGILAHHAPLITALKEGRLDVRDASGAVRSYAVGGGFFEVSDNRATVLASSAEPTS
jgi:F-type H+-transporting ATPase subunit epsilon